MATYTWTHAQAYQYVTDEDDGRILSQMVRIYKLPTSGSKDDHRVRLRQKIREFASQANDWDAPFNEWHPDLPPPVVTLHLPAVNDPNVGISPADEHVLMYREKTNGNKIERPIEDPTIGDRIQGFLKPKETVREVVERVPTPTPVPPVVVNVQPPAQETAPAAKTKKETVVKPTSTPRKPREVKNMETNRPRLRRVYYLEDPSDPNEQWNYYYESVPEAETYDPDRVVKISYTKQPDGSWKEERQLIHKSHAPVNAVVGDPMLASVEPQPVSPPPARPRTPTRPNAYQPPPARPTTTYIAGRPVSNGCLWFALGALVFLLLCGGLTISFWGNNILTGVRAGLGIDNRDGVVSTLDVVPTNTSVVVPPTAYIPPAVAATQVPPTAVVQQPMPQQPADGKMMVVTGLPANWPTTPDQASTAFGGPAARWEPCPGEGCWHFTDGEPITRLNVPAGASVEGWDGKAKIGPMNGPTSVNAAGATIRPIMDVVASQPAGQSQAPVSQPADGQKPAWPTTPQEAAAVFGGDASRWEPTADPGGWHLREEAFRIILDPKGYVLEGYYDTNPGRDPRQFVSTQPIEVQGATIWSAATPQELFCAMIGQKYRNLSVPYNQLASGIDAIGFNKPESCPAR